MQKSPNNPLPGTGWPILMVATSCWLSSDSFGSLWATSVVIYCPGRITEHFKSKSTGGCCQRDGSPCKPRQATAPYDAAPSPCLWTDPEWEKPYHWSSPLFHDLHGEFDTVSGYGTVKVQMLLNTCRCSGPSLFSVLGLAGAWIHNSFKTGVFRISVAQIAVVRA